MTEYFELGRVVKPQGVKGEVKIEAYTDSLERFSGLRFVFVKEAGTYVRKELSNARTDSKAAYLKFEGVDDRDAAGRMRGTVLYIDRANAAKLPPGHYYICDLMGMEVFLEGGVKLGVLEDIIKTGSRDVYVVALDGGGSLMFPSLSEVITERDVEGGRMTLREDKLNEVAVYDI